MNRAPLLAATLSVLLGLAPAGTAFAGDERLATRRYNADEVIRIPGKFGVQAAIALADDEHIENVAIGDATAWQVTPNKRANMLFVKPLTARAQTNMTVISDRRTYFFDLVAGPAATPLYVLRFSYPEEAKLAAKAGTTAPTLTDVEAQAMSAKVQDAAIDPSRLHFGWKPKGSSRLLPKRIYDDGQATYLNWTARMPIPAIQIRDDAGVEGPANFAVRDDVIVIDGVPGLIILRAGREMATLERETVPVKPANPQALAATALSEKGQ